jgi:hypothetical protein
MLIKLFSDDFFITVMITIIVCMFIGGVLIAIYYKPKEYSQSHLSVFIQILGSLGLLLFVIQNMVAVTFNQIVLDTQLRNNYDKTVNSIFIEPFKLLRDEKIRPEFAASFRYSNIELFNQTKDLNNPETLEVILAEEEVFNRICQSVEDMLVLQKFKQNLERIWISIMLEYSHSRFFQEKLKLFKLKYDETTQDFINLLISYSNQIEIPVKDPQLYLEKADLLLQDPKFKEILQKVTTAS